MTAISILNNNPGNIRLGDNWEGSISGSDSSFVTFATPEHGVRAMTRTLESYQDRHGLTTVNQMISRWAPPNENNTTNYVNYVAGQMGVDPNSPIDLSANPELQQRMIRAMIRMEGGPEAESYFAPHIAEGVAMATGNAVGPAYDPNTSPPPQAGNVAPTSTQPVSTQDDYDGIRGLEAIRSLEDLENGSHMRPNSLDTYSNYIYNIELFLVDSKDTIDFLTKENIGIETANGKWPNSSVNKVTVAQTGTTSEIMITDLEIESVSYGSSTAAVTNNALNVSFTLTRVGHGHIADILQDAAILAGYQNLSIANFFVRIDFKGVDENGNAFTVPGSTKVIPFRLSKLTDISTSTDARGTTAVFDGVVIRKLSVIHPEVSTLNYPMSFTINQEDAKEVLSTFISELNNKITEKHTTSNQQYVHTYSLSYSRDFEERFPTLKIGSDVSFSVGNRGGTRVSEPNTATNTTGSAAPVLSLDIGTSIVDIIKDILINTEAISGALTTAETNFTDVFSIDVEYIPKLNGYNIIQNTEGAEIKFVIGIKKLLVQQSGVNEIEQITEAKQILQEMIKRSRLCKKYYYYYTGYNDQIMDLTISLNQQLTKTINDSSTAFLDIRESLGTRDFVGNLQLREQEILENLRADSQSLEQEVQTLNRQLVGASDRLGTSMQSLSSAFTDIATQRFMQNNPEVADLNPNYELEIPADVRGNPASLLEWIQLHDDELGLSENSEIQSLIADVRSSQDTLNGIRTRISEAESGISSLGSELNRALTEVLSEQISDMFGNLNLTDTATTFNRYFDATGIDLTSPFAIEDLESDVRKTITPAELLPFLNLSITNGVRFTNLAREILNKPAEVRAASNDARRGIELARRKFIEAYQQDISMQEATMTIKGDPFWLENYKVNATNQTGGNNVTVGLENDSSSIAGPHSLMIITNTADGTDVNHNVMVSNLFRYIYVVKRVKSSFSNGLFTQTLDMNKFHLAQMIDSILTRESGIGLGNGGGEGDGTGGIGGELLSGAPGFRDGQGSSIGVTGEPSDGGTGTGGTGTGGTGMPSVGVVSENGWLGQRGTFTTLVDGILESPLPNASQSTRFLNVYREAVAAAANGSPTAQSDLDNAISSMITHFGPTGQDAANVIQGLIDSGQDVSPEFLAMLDTIYGESVSDLVTPLQPVDVTSVLTELDAMVAPAYSSPAELATTGFENMVLTPDPQISTTPPSTLQVINTNQIIDGEIVVNPPASYALSPTELAAYQEYASTRVTSNTDMQALVTTSEAIMLSKIGQEQLSMLQNVNGDFDQLTPEQQQYYNELDAAAIEIEYYALNDPARYIAQQQRMSDDLDNLIQRYDELAETTYDTSAEARDERLAEMEQVEQEIYTVDAGLQNALPKAIVPEVQNGELVSTTQVGGRPTTPVTSTNLGPTYFVSSSTDFEITEDMKTQYDEAQSILDNFRVNYPGNTYGEVTVVWEYDGVVETFQQKIVTQFENPSLAAQYGYVTGVDGATYSIDNPVIEQFTYGNFKSTAQQVVTQFPDLGYGVPTDVKDGNGDSVVSGPLTVEIGTDSIVILNPLDP